MSAHDPNSAVCPFCPATQTVYLESERWQVLRHLDPVPIAGWMMVASKAHRSGIDAMSAAEQVEFGQVLTAVAGAVRAVTGCERTYSITFNEAVRHLHMHVIPRDASDASTTSWALADRYRATMRKEREPATSEDAERAAQRIADIALVSLASLGFVRGAKNA